LKHFATRQRHAGSHRPENPQESLGKAPSPGRTYEELIARDKTSLDVFWLKDKSLTDLDNLPEPDELAEDIIENLEAGLTNFRQVLAALSKVA
jgi:type I restriction enzyme M protein